MILCMMPFAYFFITKYFSFPLLILMMVYALIIMGTHGTIWFHRYCTHRAYKFSHPFWRFITQNLVIKTIPEETYVVSHHVHHAKSDLPGDPYNSRAGLMYCMLADVNHQSISKDLDEGEYRRVSRFLSHTGVEIHTYNQYRKWGSIATPFYTIAIWLCNWAYLHHFFYTLLCPIHLA